MKNTTITMLALPAPAPIEQGNWRDIPQAPRSVPKLRTVVRQVNLAPQCFADPTRVRIGRAV